MKNSNHRKLSFLAVCFLSLPVFCQPPFPQHDQFGREHGLTDPVQQMTQDDDGFFWLATQRGLFRFDGVQATKIHLPVPDSVAAFADNIHDLSFDRKNKLLWLGTGHGIFKYDLRSGSFGHFQAKDFFKPEELDFLAARVIFTDRQGEVWADFGRYGLTHLLDGGKRAEWFYLPLTEKEKAAGLDEKVANTIRGISQDPNHDNILWMNTRRGLLKFDKAARCLERFVYYPANAKMHSDANVMNCHFAHPNGFVYIGTWDAGLLKFDPKNGTFEQFLRTPGAWSEVNGNVYRVTRIVPEFPTPEGQEDANLWTDGSGGGSLFDVKNERFTSLPMDGFNVDFRDRDGNYWQFKAGLKQFHRLKNQGRQLALPGFLPCEQLEEIPFDSRNREVYLRSFCDDGAFWSLNLDELTWQRYPLPGRPGKRVKFGDYAESPKGYFALETLHSELYLRPAGSHRFEKVPVTFPQNSGNLTLASRANGDLFIAGYGGWLFWLKPPDSAAKRKNWEMKSYTKTAFGGDLPDDFYAVSLQVFDEKGRLWMRTSEGFAIFSPENEQFRFISKKQQGVKHLRVYEFFVPDGQRMWASGSGGFGWFDVETPEAGLQKWYMPHGRYIHKTVGVQFFHAGKLWVLTNNGWTAFDPKTETFQYFDFLKTNYLTPLGDGKAIALKGKSHILLQLDSLQVSEEMPQPYVAWFKVFEKPMALPGGLLTPSPIRLEPGENFFSIGFSALAFYNPQGIRFAYQLEGVNADWVFPEPGIRAASFTNIEGGNYRFKIKTTDSRGDWLDNVYELQIHVGTPWYETWWLRLAVVAALAAGIYFLMKNRLRQQKIQLENQRLQLEKEQSLRNERDRIAAEMHDDLGAGLSTIRFLSLAAKEKENDPAKAARIDKIASHASQVMEKMADIIWVMNSRNDSLENFAAYLRRYAAEYFDTHGIRLRFAVPDLLPRISLRSEQRRTLLLAVKECLHNVVKHAGATEARVSIRTNGELEIEVRDNGKGIPHELLEQFQNNDKTLTGNGLYNLRQRMESLGGELVLENGQGISVKLKTGIVV